MLEETSRTREFSESSKDTSPVWWNPAWFRPLTAILLIAAMLRLFQLGQSSLWYDEVVTMRLARTKDPAHLLRLLQQIDATRAPLHPLLLQCWIFLFGDSDLAGRSLSALCGILTVAMVHWVGRQAFDMKTGLWAAWLSACSPLLVYYSREVRMYAWLVLVTCLGWGLLFSHRRTPKLWKSALYGLSLVAITYSHPLGMLMVGTLVLTSFLQRQAFRTSWRRWLVIHLAVAAAVLPWVGKYLDHAPESTSGSIPLRFLLGTPIAFIGGNFKVLLVCSLLIAYGLCRFCRREDGHFRVNLENPPSSVSLLIWLIVPPFILYVYSRIAHPIFGPARYTLYVGPAYLILVSRGLAKLPWTLSLAAAGVGAGLSGTMLLSDVYRSDLKADWRGAATYLSRRDPSALIAVVSPAPSMNTELETARYYLGSRRSVIAWADQPSDLMRSQDPIWVAIGLRKDQPVCELPTVLTDDRLIREAVDFSGIRLMKIDFHRAPPHGERTSRRNERNSARKSERLIVR
jgi:4-amino-4-deoxy-L-arabinose transferase-like glycosyltransferase